MNKLVISEMASKTQKLSLSLFFFFLALLMHWLPQMLFYIFRGGGV